MKMKEESVSSETNKKKVYCIELALKIFRPPGQINIAKPMNNH